jgi:hypothetical protein
MLSRPRILSGLKKQADIKSKETKQAYIKKSPKACHSVAS